MGSWISENWYWIVGFVLMVGLSFALIRLQTAMRDYAAGEIQMLLRTNPAVCAERLQNNKFLLFLFRKPIIYLWLLDACMMSGEDRQALITISKLDKMRMEPKDKLEFYQKRLSYYASADNPEEAKKSRDALHTFLKKMDALNVEPYKTIMSEADLIIGVYVDKNPALIKKLISRAEHTKNDIMRGITQFRIAKLAWFKGDMELMNTYLARAGKNLKDTWYAPIIEQAKTDPAILEYK